MKFILTSFLFSAILIASGCSSIADPTPSAPAAVMHIQDYYLPLNNSGSSLTYCVKTTTGADTVQMLMQGVNSTDKMRGGLCYSTYMSRANQRIFNYYYTMNDSEAYSLGTSCMGENSSWLDLKTPLAIGQQWTFDNSGGSFYINKTYTATVTRRGATMKMPDGKTYSDVTEVIYSSGADSTVKWFAKNVGLIYTTSKNPNSDFGQEMRLLDQK
jgi:hypothetical protein